MAGIEDDQADRRVSGKEIRHLRSIYPSRLTCVVFEHQSTDILIEITVADEVKNMAALKMLLEVRNRRPHQHVDNNLVAIDLLGQGITQIVLLLLGIERSQPHWTRGQHYDSDR